MSLMDDLEKVKRERIENLSDEEIKSVWVRKEMFHITSRGRDNFYDSGMYNEFMEVAKTGTDSQFGRYVYEKPIVNQNIREKIEDKVYDTHTPEYDSVIEFLFDELTKDEVTPQDARQKMKKTYAGTSGTPGDEIIDSVIGLKRNEEVYTIREAQTASHTGKFKLFKGNYRNTYPTEKRATRVGDTKEPLWKYLWEKAADQDVDILVINEMDNDFGDNYFDSNFISSEKAKSRMD